MKNKLKIDNLKFRIKEIKAYRYKDFKVDPNGYFVINIKGEQLMVDFYKGGKPKLRILGKNAKEVRDTIDRLHLLKKPFARAAQHAIYLGAELKKAEIAAKYGLEYEQDEGLELPMRSKIGNR